MPHPKSVRINKIKRIALVAHDHRKPVLLEWIKYNKGTLSGHELYATGTTGKLIRDQVGLEVHSLISGPLGGDSQIGAMVCEKKLDFLFFFWDPLAAQPHDPDVKALLRLAVVWNLPMACNRATADFLISSPLMNGTYERELVDYEAHLNRQLP
ncbi:MAG: methylglyoxal synthase [Candidatus Lambdaproteobacteria bacterium RIFOXYD1_FULL_56_27]|uniref:Methylglyoxal synthase n=1 Tax=Candidatus Lambdaproteobacteria bacterium RIFOXYD2_FULL_56_26 TaxID=1817773 RepID=A0A1F6GSF7_9PROT|nr:MAG: methylglyoxal synthase [Candidatus Lambdaproteobacteria bacterium RIFOXYD2_FULL_56_26]OGH01322.1 MAG: methylglyoxal synthase [Candidatus Lambdaproteobacteria bacterium RIFOXYC1_FULL_56_13]OGH06862.1 MAG: methylglyoxal synthase [Candidatus Lambdaproteobacteria bacterium RIFOXYD1_FULL_56_27]